MEALTAGILSAVISSVVAATIMSIKHNEAIQWIKESLTRTENKIDSIIKICPANKGKC